MRNLIFLILTICITQKTYSQSAIIYDIVINGGRVIDPETRLDTIKNIGIQNNRITQITSEAIKGKQVINAKGLVVAPGFIDIHVHGVTNKEQEYQLHDGLTTALELESGVPYIADFYNKRNSKALINFGASACWSFERYKAFKKYKPVIDSVFRIAETVDARLEKLSPTAGQSQIENLDQDEIKVMLGNIQASLNEGALGIGVPLGYLKTISPTELYELFKFSAALKVVPFVHVRQPDVFALQEAMAYAMLTGSPLHLVHVNSMSLKNIQFALDMLATARKNGYDITTELYPYTAASTSLETAMFDEGWQQRLGISYQDLQWVATGERLTKETFEKYRKQGGTVIMHMMKPEWIKSGIAAPGTIIASDGMPYAPLAHPRTAGTFSRVLGKYVREDKVLDLSTAIEKMTLLPAKRLETVAPMMRYKGRIQIGADADITIFNADKVIDKGTFDKGLAFSDGIEYVIVAGIVALKNGKTVPAVFAGQPIFGKYKK